MIKIRLKTYNFTGNAREVNKNIGNPAHIIENCAWLENTSFIDPIFTFNNIDDSLNIINENYFEIPKWGRYYFVTDIQYLEGGIIQLQGHVDVLKTFQKDIEASTQFVSRQENDYNKMIADNLIPMQSRKVTDVYPIDQNDIFTNTVGKATANSRFIVLQTMGSGGGD